MLDGLFIGNQTRRQQIPHPFSHPQNLFLRTGDHSARVSCPPFCRRLGDTFTARSVGQSFVSGGSRFDALLCAVERGNQQTGSCADNQLCLLRSAGHDRHGRTADRGADHLAGSRWSRIDPRGDVAGRKALTVHPRRKGLVDHFQPDDSDNNQQQEEHSPEGDRIVEEQDAENDRADAADSRPDDVSRTHRNRLLSQIQQPAAQCHRHDSE